VIALAAAAAFSGASLQSATGFGFALVLSPALFALLEPAQAVTALLGLGLALNLLVLADGGEVHRRSLVPVLAAALPGLALGAALLAILPKAALQVAVGVGVLGAAAIVGRAPEPAGPRPARRRGAWLAGLASGALTTSLSLSGPPLVLWLRGRGLSPADLRATLAAAFLALNLAGVALLLAVQGGAAAVEPWLLGLLLALVLAGHLAGAWVFRRLDSERFSALALGLVAASGAASVAAGVAGAY